MMKFNSEEERKAYNCAKSRRWRERHPEKAKETAKKWLEHNPEKAKKANENWYKNNTEKARKASRERMRQFRNMNPEKAQESVKLWREQNSERNRESSRKRYKRWSELNPKKLATKQRIIRAKRLGAEGSHTTEETDYLLIRQYYMCWNAYCMCDLRTNPKALDHKVSLAKGGSNSIENLQWLCVPCNTRKGTLSVDDWLKREEKRAA